jgi:SAM-dependent methyltransferase
MDVDTREGPRIGDAFGAMLMAVLEVGEQPGTVREIVERDDGYLDGQDAVYYFLPHDQWDRLDQWLAERATGRVLDVGAGAGRAALHFQSQGRPVTALDISQLACETCRRRGVHDVVEGTVLDLARSGVRPPFDTVLMLGNNLGLFESRRFAPVLLDALAALTTLGARILGRCVDPYVTDNPFHLGYHRRNEAMGRMPGQLRIRIRYQDMATPFFEYLFASADELRSVLAGTAWTLDEYEADGPTYAVVIKKRGEARREA